MHRRTHTIGWATLALLAVGCIAPAAHASALGAGPHAGPSGPQPALSGYTVVTAGPFDNPAGTQTEGSATCPAGTVVLSGGSQSTSTSVAVNINSSWPSSTTSWSVTENNDSAADAQFTLSAICAKKPRSYAIVATDVTAPPGQLQSVSCAPKSQPSGGGVQWQSTSLLDNLDSTFPQRPHFQAAKQWVVVLDMGSGLVQPATAYAVCWQIPGRKLVNDVLRVSSPGTQAAGSATCPSTTILVGGGSNSNFNVSGIDDQSEFPQSSSWRAVENNSSAMMNALATTAVCAK